MCRQKCDADIRNSLTSLPKDLPQTYERVLSRIVEEGNTEIVERIFRWIAVAKRPLLLEELQEAIAIEPGDQFLQRDRLVNDADRLIPWCTSLVTSDEEDLIVQFAHHTVKQFLLSEHYNGATKRFHFQLPEADHIAGEICVTYLNFNDFKRQMIQLPRAHLAIQPKDLVANTVALGQNRLAKYGLKFARMVTKKSRAKFDVIQHLDYTSGRDSISSLERLQIQYSFLAYASEFWLSHTARFTQESTHIWALWKRLVCTEHPLAMKPWTTDDEGNTEEPITECILNQSHYALVACLYGTQTFGRPSINMLNLLIQASRRGNCQMVEFILSFDDSTASSINKSLQVAAGGGHLAVIERLLAAGADVNVAAVGYDGGTAMQAAAGGGHLEVIERLLTVKADINAAAARGNGRTALQAAAGGGHLRVVERLLAVGTNVNAAAAASNGRTALQAAAEGGHLGVVERLLAAKADVNAAAAASNGHTALQAAAEGGHLGVVEGLLAAGADVNAEAARYGGGRTAIQAAAGGGHLGVVERLLTAGADVNAAEAASNKRTALQAAAEGGHLGVVERLLAAKADVNAAAAAYDGRTALQAAAGGGYLGVVERLLAAKADVNTAAAHDHGRTAIQAAAGGGHLGVVERLLTAGADVNAAAAGYDGRTALQAAAEGGHLGVVERLLTAGANVLKAMAESSIMCTVCLTDALYLRGKALYLYTDGAIPCLSMHIHAYAPNELLCFHSLMQRSFRLIHAGFRH